MPAIKNSETNNVILHYTELTGIKLTLLLPILNS